MSELSAGARSRVIWALGLTQVIGYGTLYYSFSALAPAIGREFGWSLEWVYAALSVSLLVGGVAAPISGSWADRFGAARLMAWGSVGAALALALMALAPNGPAFVAGLMAVEIASAFVLYSTAFAALAQLTGPGAQRAIVHLTLIAGFASTVFWPLTTALHATLSWREVYLVYAALNLVACLPAHIWLARQGRRAPDKPQATAASERPALVPPSAEAGAQLLMLAGFALLGFVSSAVLMHMIPLLTTLGMGTAGVLVTTLFGPAQVLSRVVNMQFGKGLSQAALAAIAAGLMPLALVLLATTAPWMAGGAAFAILFGLGSGLSSIVSGTLPLALFGAGRYGRRLGLISSARLVVSSFAPVVFAVVAGLLSTQVALWLVVLTGLLGSACFVGLWLRFDRQVAAPIGEASSPRS